ncbi:hypothetical protein MMC30_002067 [Trapelia coarctata]|nr:hypothetical protein [Trapelia coarctata]
MEKRPSGTFSSNDPKLFAMAGIEPISTQQWEAAFHFFSRAWFQRLWIVQEAALSRALHFWCGDTGFPWSLLAEFVTWIYTVDWQYSLEPMHARQFTVQFTGIGSLYQIIEIGNCLDNGLNDPFIRKKLSLLFGIEGRQGAVAGFLGITIHMNQHRLVGDAKDKVYSPLAMTVRFQSHADEPLPKPEYDRTVQQIYQGTAEYPLEHSNSLAVLSLVDERVTRTVPGLPSWTPDWSVEMSHEPLIMLDRHDATKN